MKTHSISIYPENMDYDCMFYLNTNCSIFQNYLIYWNQNNNTNLIYKNILNNYFLIFLSTLLLLLLSLHITYTLNL